MILDELTNGECKFSDLGKFRKLRKLGLYIRKKSFAPEGEEMKLFVLFRALNVLAITWIQVSTPSKPENGQKFKNLKKLWRKKEEGNINENIFLNLSRSERGGMKKKYLEVLLSRIVSPTAWTKAAPPVTAPVTSTTMLLLSPSSIEGYQRSKTWSIYSKASALFYKEKLYYLNHGKKCRRKLWKP